MAKDGNCADPRSLAEESATDDRGIEVSSNLRGQFQ